MEEKREKNYKINQTDFILSTELFDLLGIRVKSHNQKQTHIKTQILCVLDDEAAGKQPKAKMNIYGSVGAQTQVS